MHKGGEARCSLGDSQGAGGRPQPGWAICQPIITLAEPSYLGEQGMCLLGVCLSLSLRSCRKLPPEGSGSRFHRKTPSVSRDNMAEATKSGT